MWQFTLVCVYFTCLVLFFFFKQKTAYEMRISDWSSDVCSSDLIDRPMLGPAFLLAGRRRGKAAKQRGAFGRLGSSHFPHDLAGLDGADVTASLPVGVVRIAKAIDNGIEDIARLGELLSAEERR